VTANDARNGEEGPVRVRGASPTDAPDVCRLLAALGYPAEVAVVRERIASFDTSGRDHVLLAELEGQIVGVPASLRGSGRRRLGRAVVRPVRGRLAARAAPRRAGGNARNRHAVCSGSAPSEDGPSSVHPARGG
jgi:hypothetical protein